MKYARETLFLDDKLKALRSKETYNQNLKESNAKEHILMAKGRPDKRDPHKKDKKISKFKTKKVKCYQCHKMGHIKECYPNLKNNDKPKE